MKAFNNDGKEITAKDFKKVSYQAMKRGHFVIDCDLSELTRERFNEYTRIEDDYRVVCYETAQKYIFGYYTLYPTKRFIDAFSINKKEIYGHRNETMHYLLTNTYDFI